MSRMAVVFAFGAVLIVCGADVAAGANVALSRPYALEPAPNYQYCTEAGDATQLTDGAYTEGYFWTQPGTVGWNHTNPVVVTIDLGEVRPIRGISLNSAAGVAGVAWPLNIDIYVADEPGQFHHVGDLIDLSGVNGSPPMDAYTVHRFMTDALRTHGRYVAIAVTLQGFFFTDEIEILEGDASWLAEPLPGPAVATATEATLARRIEGAIRRRIRNDVQTLENMVAASTASADAKAPVMEKLGVLREEVALPLPQPGDDFRAVLPLNALHARVFQARAELWRAEGRNGLTVWPASPWEWLELFAEPPGKAAGSLDVHAMNNEYRAAAVNVSNAADADATVHVRVEGLPGGVNPEYVRVAEVAWTDTAAGTAVAAALPAAQRDEQGYVITIPSGMTRQVWFTFHPVDITPGEHAGAVVVEGAGPTQSLPLRLKVYPFTLSPTPALHFGGWDYTNSETHYEVTASNKQALIDLLREYFVDSPWATNAVIPYGSYSPEGEMTTPPDTSNFDAWLGLWPDARQYLIFAAVGEHIHSLMAGSPEFNKAVGAWIRFWEQHAKDKGIRPEQIAMLIFDEPHAQPHYDLIKHWQKAIRATGTKIRIWEDPTFDSPAAADVEMLALCDVLCPNTPLFLQATPEYRELFLNQRDEGRTLEFYSCSGPVRTLDPYTYHRLQAWQCRRYGATAGYFWAFGDSGGATSWNEYAAKGNAYTPLFIDKDNVTPGKHLEACREGIEDYEYFVMLDAMIQEARKNGKNAAVIAEAQALLDTLPAEVCDAALRPGYNWQEPLDRGQADTARVRMLEMMERLAR